MYHLLCCMKSKDSYNRIVNQFTQANVEWEDHVYDLDDIKGKMVLNEYDFAVVDEKLWWKTEAIEYFDKHHIGHCMFQGDFEEILKQLALQFPDTPPAPEEEPAAETSAPVPGPSTDVDADFFHVAQHTKIVKEVVEIEKPVYTPMYTGMSNYLICVLNLSQRAGSSFITLNLAKMISNMKILTCVVEPPLDKPYIFDTVGLDVRIKSHNAAANNVEFYSYPHAIADGKKILRDKETIEDGIVWLVADSRKPVINDKSKVDYCQEQLFTAIEAGDPEAVKRTYDELNLALHRWDYYKMMKLIYASKKANVFIVDCGSNFEHESIKSIIQNEADMILVVADPLPTECMQNEKRLDQLLELKRQGLPVEFVVNRWSSGINRDHLLDYLRVTPLAIIPEIDSRFIYEAIYNYKFPVDNKDVEDKLSKPMFNIIKKFVPPEIIKGSFMAKEIKHIEPSFISKILRRFKRK